MNYVTMNVYKGQRMDITASMKDADEILNVFRTHGIRFEKKYTTINDDAPSTITFKGLRAEKAHTDLTNMIVDLYMKAKDETISNVCVKLTSFMNQRRNEAFRGRPVPVHAVQESTEAAVMADHYASESEPISSDDTL